MTKVLDFDEQARLAQQRVDEQKLTEEEYRSLVPAYITIDTVNGGVRFTYRNMKLVFYDQACKCHLNINNTWAAWDKSDDKIEKVKELFKLEF